MYEFKWCECPEQDAEKISGKPVYYCNKCNQFIEPVSVEMKKDLARVFKEDAEYILKGKGE